MSVEKLLTKILNVNVYFHCEKNFFNPFRDIIGDLNKRPLEVMYGSDSWTLKKGER